MHVEIDDDDSDDAPAIGEAGTLGEIDSAIAQATYNADGERTLELRCERLHYLADVNKYGVAHADAIAHSSTPASLKAALRALSDVEFARL